MAGIVGSTEVSQLYHDSLQPHLQNTSEVATRLFVDQLYALYVSYLKILKVINASHNLPLLIRFPPCRLKTAVKLLVLYVFVSPYQPFPDDVFSYSMYASLLNWVTNWPGLIRKERRKEIFPISLCSHNYLDRVMKIPFFFMFTEFLFIIYMSIIGCFWNGFPILFDISSFSFFYFIVIKELAHCSIQ